MRDKGILKGLGLGIGLALLAILAANLLGQGLQRPEDPGRMMFYEELMRGYRC